jgi:hypothetical protein
MLAGNLHPAAPFHILGQRAHGFPGYFGAFAAINRSFRNIDSRKDFAAAAFTLDPKLHRGLHGIFWTLQPAACDGLPHKILLLRREVYLHRSNVCRPSLKIQGFNDFNPARADWSPTSPRNARPDDRLRRHPPFQLGGWVELFAKPITRRQIVGSVQPTGPALISSTTLVTTSPGEVVGFARRAQLTRRATTPTSGSIA